MTRSPALLLSALVALLLVTSAWGDAVRLKTGDVVVGRITRRTATHIVIQKEDGTEAVLPAADVAQVIPGDVYTTWLGKRRDATTTRAKSELVKWCRDRGLKPEGDLIIEEVLRDAPDDDEARVTMGFRKIEDAWVHPEVVAAMERAPAPKDIRWGLEWDASKEDFESWKEIVRKSAAHLWRATEGQIWLRSVKLMDRFSGGEVRVDPSGEHPLCGPGQVHLARTWYPAGQHYTFVHSWGHSFLGLADEYIREGNPSKVPTEATCVMGTSSFAGFCDAASHTWAGSDCWSRILKMNPKFRHPNPFPSDAPPVRIEVMDK